MYKVIMIHPNAGMSWGNSENFALEIARHLDKYFEVKLLSGADCGSFSHPIASISRSEVLDWSYYPLLNKILRRWFDRPEIAIEHLTSFLPCISYLIRHQADLIFPHNDYGGLLSANCVRAIRGTPILFRHHSLLRNRRNIERNLSLKPNRAIAHNPTVAKYIKHLAPQQALNIIPYGIDLSLFNPIGKTINTYLPKPIILCVASLKRNSNSRIEKAIAAVARLPQASLLICGGGKDRAYFQQLGDRLLGRDRFQIKAFPYARMPEVYRSADLYTLPSLEASSGLTYLEAMACGLPVVATNDSVRRYLIGDAGITCDVTNIDTYARSLQLALEQYWYQQQPQTNALRFSWQEIALQYRKTIIQTIMQSKNKHFASLTSSR